jgi:LysM repeat protein
MAKTYVIQSGDSLSKIGQKFGVDWKDVWAANKSSISDPNKIYSGKSILIPDKSLAPASGGSLEKTLPSETVDEGLGAGAPAGGEAALPEKSGDQLSALKIALREASSLATKRGISAGNQAMLGGFEKAGISPDKVSGSLVKGIVNFTESRVKPSIESLSENIGDIVDSISKKSEETKSESRSQITQMISGGMWNKLDDNQRKTLWTAAGYTGEPVMSKDDNIEYYHTTDNDGNVWNVGFDKSTGAITTKSNLGKIGSSGTNPVDKITLQDATKQMAGKLKESGRLGADGKISPEDYALAKSAWVEESGFSGKDFDEAMANYRNQSNNDYILDTEYKGS